MSARSRQSGSSDRASLDRASRPPQEPGQQADAGGLELRSYQVGLLPIVNRLLQRMRLREILAEHLPPDDPRLELSTSSSLLVLVRNVLLSRQPVYGVGEWAAQFAPDLLDLWPEDVSRLHDDRLGRALDRLFDSVGPELILAVVRQVVQEFAVSLDELHNDSTSVSFFGAYEGAGKEGTQRGRATHAITWGHSKDHRPDLKQLLYILTISEDGGVPVYFTTASGNQTDDCTHIQTWDLLHQLVGRPEFLYVADCKLASSENLAHIATRGGRFVTVLPRTHKEDEVFRARLRQSPTTITWKQLYDVTDEQGELHDRFSVCAEQQTSSDGYRLLWYHSTRKAQIDTLARNRRLQRAWAELADLQARLKGPRTRYRQRVKVEQAVERILEEAGVAAWLHVTIEEQGQDTYRQARPGRPTEKTPYRKETRLAYALAWKLDEQLLTEAEREDGVFPLLTNDRTFDAEQVLRAYKRQPLIEKRFSQFKTDFAVAPVYLKNVARIQGLLAVYFFVLLLQTLLERELRRAMARHEMASLPLYPEGRACTRPTTSRLIELFEPLQRHVVQSGADDDENQEPLVLITKLTTVQRKIVQLLGLQPTNYGR
ncbi:MAG: IS1634 family transposase [Woeseiaceae bacterium]